MSLLVSLAAFIWGLRSGQFSDQDRARYLPLGEDLLSQPVVVAGRRKQKAHTTALLVVVALGLIAFGVALFLSIHHR
jgi:cbb3-type cytochrome oxidase maturation protein